MILGTCIHFAGPVTYEFTVDHCIEIYQVYWRLYTQCTCPSHLRMSETVDWYPSELRVCESKA